MVSSQVDSLFQEWKNKFSRSSKLGHYLNSIFSKERKKSLFSFAVTLVTSKWASYLVLNALMYPHPLSRFGPWKLRQKQVVIFSVAILVGTKQKGKVGRGGRKRWYYFWYALRRNSPGYQSLTAASGGGHYKNKTKYIYQDLPLQQEILSVFSKDFFPLLY